MRTRQKVDMRTQPFQGRASERAKISAVFRGSAAGAAMITSPAGIGITRLAREVLSALGAEITQWIGATPSCGECYEVSGHKPTDCPRSIMDGAADLWVRWCYHDT
jgi:hypothetical protein